MAEYGLEVEIQVTGNSVRVGKLNDRTVMAMGTMAVAQRDYRELDNISPKISNVRFPKYPVDGDETPDKLVSIFKQDFWNWLGKDVHSEGEKLEIVE